MIKIISFISFISFITFTQLSHGEKIYSGIEDLIHYSRIKSNDHLTQSDLLMAKKRHLLRFPQSPFTASFDLLIYDKKFKSIYSKIKSKKIRNKKSKEQLTNLYIQSTKVEVNVFAKYVNEMDFEVNELDFLESLLFINVFIHGQTPALIKPFKKYIHLYKEKNGRNWHIRYWKHLRSTAKNNVGLFAWYTYKVSEFSTANFVYSKAIEYQSNSTYWFYLGLTSFYLSKYRKAKDALQFFLNSEPNEKNLKFHQRLTDSAHYYYYYSLDKLREGKNQLKEIHNHCKKKPSERMYRLLLRMAKRYGYKHHKAIQKKFLKLYPKSHTAYLQNREKAFSELKQKRITGKKFLKKAYGHYRQKDYQEIVLWLFGRNKEKENHFSKGENWFLDYFYQQKLDDKSWQRWMSKTKSRLNHTKKFDNDFIKKNKVFYLTNEKKKWAWFEKTDRGFSSNVGISYGEQYLKRISAFIRFGYKKLIEKEIKRNFKNDGTQKLFYLGHLYSQFSNTYEQSPSLSIID